MMIYRTKIKLLKTTAVIALITSTLCTYSLVLEKFNTYPNSPKFNAALLTKDRYHADRLTGKRTDHVGGMEHVMVNSKPTVEEILKRHQRSTDDYRAKRIQDRSESQEGSAQQSNTSKLKSVHHRMHIKSFSLNVVNKHSRSANVDNDTSLHVVDSYFRNRTVRMTPLDYKLIIKSQPCFDGQVPTFLVVLCPSNFDHNHTRTIIRQTWASVTKPKVWPIRDDNVSDVIVRFIIGSGGLNESHMEGFRHEDSIHGDIIVSDFKDSYYNLTRKVLIGLKWVYTFCPNARYVLKIDEDTFLQMGNLISYLKQLKSNSNGIIIGHVYTKPLVLRKGKWGLQSSVYPYTYYPPYVCGNSYVISADVIKQIVTWSEYLPYVFIEDVAITGIFRTAINASLLSDGGFTFYARPSPRLCDFLSNTTIKTATKTNDELKQKIWNTFNMTFSECKRYEEDDRRKETKLKRKH